MVKPKTWTEYFTPEELVEMSRPEFMDEVERLTQQAWKECEGKADEIHALTL
jgi:hypothetical protein